MSDGDRLYIKRLLIAMALAAVALLLWQLMNLWMLLFGAVMVAVILRALADPIERYTSLSPVLSLAMAGALILLIAALAVWLAGSAVQGQMEDLAARIPAAWESVKAYIDSSRIGSRMRDWAGNSISGDGMLSGLSKATGAVIGSTANLLLIVFGGIYLAARPKFYISGTLKLIPPDARESIADVMRACGSALHLWLKGQLISMIIVGVLITLGLWLIGLPSALALGLIAGLGEFIPIVGTLFAALPALILALAQSPSTALWTLVLFIIVQQVQGNIVMPMIQQHMVYLPPALTLFALMAFTLLFGPLGLLFAAPMTVVAYVAIKKLYIRDTLGERTKVPGEN